MVLDSGEMVEFDSPQALLDKKTGLFHRLVEESSDKEELYRLVQH
jgi:ABC-type multidrug transport system fused ATPase/permease subunit